MQRAIKLAEESVAKGGFPAGSVLTLNGQIIAEGISIGNILNDPTSHSELATIRSACTTHDTSHLENAVLYASMQPCVMCLGAAMWGGIREIFYACRQSEVSAEYYGGHYHGADINAQFLDPIKLTHMQDHEAASLSVVKSWEAKLGH